MVIFIVAAAVVWVASLIAGGQVAAIVGLLLACVGLYYAWGWVKEAISKPPE